MFDAAGVGVGVLEEPEAAPVVVVAGLVAGLVWPGLAGVVIEGTMVMVTPYRMFERLN